MRSIEALYAPAERVVGADEPASQRVQGNPRKVLAALDAYEGMTIRQVADATTQCYSGLQRWLDNLCDQHYVETSRKEQRSQVYGLTAAGRDTLA